MTKFVGIRLNKREAFEPQHGVSQDEVESIINNNTTTVIPFESTDHKMAFFVICVIFGVLAIVYIVMAAARQRNLIRTREENANNRKNALPGFEL
uniref:Small integral membrane protein 8 n=1 Tax=Rhabditophanes sp. KR3021 TaxID=114890 RepID=A0AC35TZE4_9BILA